MQPSIVLLSLLFFYPYSVLFFGASPILSGLNLALYVILSFCIRPVFLSSKLIAFNLVFLLLFIVVFLTSITPFYSIFATFRAYYFPFALLCYILSRYTSECSFFAFRKFIVFFFSVIFSFQVLEIFSLQSFPFLLPLLQPGNELGIYSRPINFFQDYQSAPFIFGLAILYFLANKKYSALLVTFLVLCISNIRTHLFASIVASLAYILLPSITNIMLRAKLKPLHFVVFVLFTFFVLVLALPILLQQIEDGNSSLNLSIQYVADDFLVFIESIRFFGVGILDYSSEGIFSVYTQAVLRNEIGFFRMLFELGLIPTLFLLVNLSACVLRSLSRDIFLGISVLIFIFLGLLHHVTLFNPLCMLFLAFFLLDASYSPPVSSESST